MASTSDLETVYSLTLDTPRLQTHLLVSGAEDDLPLIFIHDNVTSAYFFLETLATLPTGYQGLAPDLRGFGGSEAKAVEATRGLRDFSDDLHSLVETLLLAEAPLHLVGWSMGGGVAMQYTLDHPQKVATLTLVAPISPYGFGGSKDADGTPIWPDYAGSGGGIADAEFVKRLAENDQGDASDSSPRNVLNRFYFKPPFQVEREREDRLVNAMLSTATGEENYPGDSMPSDNWPGMAPGTRGVNNALSPAYLNLSRFSHIFPQPDVLWIRGDSDQIVSDTSAFDFGYLGQIGAVPGWPGADVYPPQPMLGQTRALLDAYAAAGGSYQEEILPACGHSPHIEQPEAFWELLARFLRTHS